MYRLFCLLILICSHFNSVELVFFDIRSEMYTVAILRKYSFITAGALISESWVITDGNELYSLKARIREIHVRIGSKNYKNGGLNVPIKYFETHPHFNDTTPNCDVGLIQLAEKISHLTAKPIEVFRYTRGISSAHFVVTYWTAPIGKQKFEVDLSHAKLLKTSHLHPGSQRKCKTYLQELQIPYNRNIMCLDPIVINDPCSRETWRGAPVVLDNQLVGIISSYVPGYCDLDTSIFVNLISAPEIFRWVNRTVTDLPQQW